MRAAVYTEYGRPEVVQIREVPTPAPEQNEVLVRVHATTVCAADWRFRKADPFLIRFLNGLRRPNRIRILGMEFAGTVESVGASVTRFRPGDRVFGSTGGRFGAHAEFVCVPDEGTLGIKPTNMTLEQSAAILFGGISALHFLRKANIGAGQRVLVYGASGSVGVFAVQLAKDFGAHVTAVCSTANLDLVSSLGADEVIDYKKEDFSRSGIVYDVIFDTVGRSGFSRSLKCLRRGGAYVRVGGSGRVSSILGGMLRARWLAITGRARVISGVARGNPADQTFLTRLVEAGKLRTVIDKSYSLDQIAAAHRHAEGGHKKGHVLVVIGAEDQPGAG